MRLLASIAWSCLLTLGCGAPSYGRATVREAGDIGMETAGAPADASVENDEASAAGSQGPTPPADIDAPPTPDLTVQPTVWIGETDRTVTFPDGDYDGGNAVAEGAGSGTPTPPERVVLMLNTVTDSVTGTIAFGDIGPPPPAVDPKQPYPPGLVAVTALMIPDSATIEGFEVAYWSAPYPGFSYSLVSSRLTGNLVNLAFVPAEIWRDWCALQDPTVSPHPYVTFDGRILCDCGASSCRARSSPILRIDLTVSGDGMQGQLTLPGDGFELTPAASVRLQRVQ